MTLLCSVSIGKEEIMKAISIIFYVIIVITISLPIWLTTEAVSLKETASSMIIPLLGSLFVIALFLERSLDVFLTTWRAEGSEKLNQEIRNLEHQISKFEDNKDLISDLEKKKQERIERSSKTRLIALWSGLFFGLLVGVVGIRTLQTLVDPVSLSQIPTIQLHLFRVLDVLLTGGLVAGGSDNIHKLIEVYRNVMETSSTKAKQQVEK